MIEFFSVQNEPEVLLELFSPLNTQSWSYPLAKSTGLRFLLMEMRAAALALGATSPQCAKNLVWFSLLLLFSCEGLTQDLGCLSQRTRGEVAVRKGTVAVINAALHQLPYTTEVVLKANTKILLKEGKIVSFDFALLQQNRNFNAPTILGQAGPW